jgi:hypothetical protein
LEVKSISKLLGHASVKKPCNRYIHFFKGDIDDTSGKRQGRDETQAALLE